MHFQAQIEAEYGQEIAQSVLQESRDITFNIVLRRPWMRSSQVNHQDLIHSVACEILLAMEMGCDLAEAKLEAIRAMDRFLRSEVAEPNKHHRLDQSGWEPISFDPAEMEHSEAGHNAFAMLDELATARQAEIVSALANLGPQEVGDMFGISKQSVISARNQVRAKFERAMTP